jgi:hypothetical protein
LTLKTADLDLAAPVTDEAPSARAPPQGLPGA